MMCERPPGIDPSNEKPMLPATLALTTKTMFSAARTTLAASWAGRRGELVGCRITSAPCIM